MLTFSISRRRAVLISVIAALALVGTGVALAADGAKDPLAPSDDAKTASFQTALVGSQSTTYELTSGLISRCFVTDTVSAQHLATNVQGNLVNLDSVTQTVRVVNTITDTPTFDRSFTLGPGATTFFSGLGIPNEVLGTCTFVVQVFTNSLSVLPSVRSAAEFSDRLSVGPKQFQILVNNGSNYVPLEGQLQRKTHSSYSCAEGSTIVGRFDLFLLMVSPTDQTVTMTFARSNGAPVTHTKDLLANQRITVKVNDFGDVNGQDGVSTRIDGTAPFDLASSMIANINGSSSLAEITCAGL